MLSRFFRQVRPLSVRPSSNGSAQRYFPVLNPSQTDQEIILAKMNQILSRVQKISPEFLEETNTETARELINRFSVLFELNQSHENLLEGLENLRNNIDRLRAEINKVTRFNLSITSTGFKVIGVMFLLLNLGGVGWNTYSAANEKNKILLSVDVVWIALGLFVTYMLANSMNGLRKIQNDLANLYDFSERLTSLLNNVQVVHHHPPVLMLGTQSSGVPAASSLMENKDPEIVVELQAVIAKPRL